MYATRRRRGRITRTGTPVTIKEAWRWRVCDHGRDRLAGVRVRLHGPPQTAGAHSARDAAQRRWSTGTAGPDQSPPAEIQAQASSGRGTKRRHAGAGKKSRGIPDRPRPSVTSSIARRFPYSTSMPCYTALTGAIRSARWETLGAPAKGVAPGQRRHTRWHLAPARPQDALGH